MSEEIDHMKAFEALAISQSTDHVDLMGLDEARAHQRGEKVGKRVIMKSRRFSEQQVRDMMHSRDPVEVIARRNGTSRITVQTYRRKAGR